MKKITFFLFLFVVLINSQKVKAVVPEKSDSTKVVKVYMVDTIHKKVYVVDSIITTTYIENTIYYYGDGVRYRRYYNIIPYYSYCWSTWGWGYYPSWHSFHHRNHYYSYGSSYRNRGYNYYSNQNNSSRNYGQKPIYRNENGGSYNQHRPYRGNSSNSGTSRYSSPQKTNTNGRNSYTQPKNSNNSYRQQRQHR